MAWRVATSLNVLLEQLNAIAPHRSKISDGSIGDAAHATRDSDHNPWYGPGIVTARDFTHDIPGGLDCHWLAAALVRAGDGRIKYIIWNRKIWSGGTWRNYTGVNPHTKHLHLSVVASAAADDPRPWNLETTQPPEDDMTPDELLNHPIPRVGSALKGNTTLRAVIANWDRALELEAARDRVTAAAITALSNNPDIDPAALQVFIRNEIKANTPTAAQNAAALRPLLEEVMRDVIPDEQADEILRKIAEKLGASEGN